YGVKNDGTDTEDDLNNLEEGYAYFFTEGNYGVRGFEGTGEGGLIVKNNTRYYFHDNAQIVVLPNSSSRYTGILIENVKNFELHNISVTGDRYSHNYLGENHEQGHGIMVRGDSQGLIDVNTIIDTIGDGISF